jgi:serine protease
MVPNKPPPAVDTVPRIDGLIILLKRNAAVKGSKGPTMSAALAAELGAYAGITIRPDRHLWDGIERIQLGRKITRSEAETIAARLRTHPAVLAADPEGLSIDINAVPTDPQYLDQWSLRPGSPGSINAESAWAISTGASSVTIAVIDSGILAHADLAARLVAGYDLRQAALQRVRARVMR